MSWRCVTLNACARPVTCPVLWARFYVIGPHAHLRSCMPSTCAFDRAVLLEHVPLPFAGCMPAALEAEAQGAWHRSITTGRRARHELAACPLVALDAEHMRLPQPNTHPLHAPSTALHSSSSCRSCMLAACPPRCRPKHNAPSGGQLLRAVAHGVVWPHAHP
jgi:hypothetical protein